MRCLCGVCGVAGTLRRGLCLECDRAIAIMAWGRGELRGSITLTFRSDGVDVTGDLVPDHGANGARSTGGHA
jgi:hypothetical protein